MKKLTLNLGSVKEMLNKEQLKKIAGGGYDVCDSDCNNSPGDDCPKGQHCACAPAYPPGTCAADVCLCFKN